MSLKVMNLVWAAFPHGGALKLCLLRLAQAGDDAGKGIYITNDRLAQDMGCHERYARRLLEQLREEGWIEIVGNETGGRSLFRRMKINLEKFPESVLERCLYGQKKEGLQAHLYEQKEGAGVHLYEQNLVTEAHLYDPRSEEKGGPMSPKRWAYESEKVGLWGQKGGPIRPPDSERIVNDSPPNSERARNDEKGGHPRPPFDPPPSTPENHLNGAHDDPPFSCAGDRPRTRGGGEEKKRQKPKEKSPLPPDFAVTPSHRDFAREHGCPDPQECIVKFKLHHGGHGTLARDWDAMFCKWLLDERERQTQNDRRVQREENQRASAPRKLPLVEQNWRAGREYLRREGALSDEDWETYQQIIGERRPDPLQGEAPRDADDAALEENLFGGTIIEGRFRRE